MKIAAIALSSVRAAAVEVAVLLEQLERIDATSPRASPRPRRGARAAAAASARPVPRSRATRLPLRRRGPEQRMSAFGMPAARSRAAIASAARRRAAGRVGRVDLDELLVDLARERAIGLGHAPRWARAARRREQRPASRRATSRLSRARVYLSSGASVSGDRAVARERPRRHDASRPSPIDRVQAQAQPLRPARRHQVHPREAERLDLRAGPAASSRFDSSPPPPPETSCSGGSGASGARRAQVVDVAREQELRAHARRRRARPRCRASGRPVEGMMRDQDAPRALRDSRSAWVSSGQRSRARRRCRSAVES